jgi:hypothetical protein
VLLKSRGQRSTEDAPDAEEFVTPIAADGLAVEALELGEYPFNGRTG